MDAKEIGLIVAKKMPPPGSKGGGDDAPSDEGDGMDGAGKSALEDMFAAMKSGDMDAAWSAFKDAAQICGGKSYSEE
jgi:hypothetical protein